MKKRMDNFDSRLDQIEQKERENNVVAADIPSDKDSKDQVRKILNKKLNCNVALSHILYKLELNKNDETTKSTLSTIRKRLKL